MTTDPAMHLRSMGDEAFAVQGGSNQSRSLMDVSQIQAVANAFVMLGLLPAQHAEIVLAELDARLDSFGVRDASRGELTVDPSVVDFWKARSRTPADLSDVPLRVALPQLELRVAGATLYVDSLIVTPSGLRGRGRAEADLTEEAQAGLTTAALSELTAVDDHGQDHPLRMTGGVTITDKSSDRARHQTWTGEWTSAAPVPFDTAWLDVHAPDSDNTYRVAFSAPPTVPAGTTAPVWPTPAETYLAWLAPEPFSTDPDASFGIGLNSRQAIQVVAAVADALLAVGALPPDTDLLRRLPDRDRPPWAPDIAARWTQRAQRQRTDLDRVRPRLAAGAAIPLHDAVAVVEYISVVDDAVTLHLYVSPDVRGQYWPVNVPGVTVEATDEHGTHYTNMPATHWGGSTPGEGHGDLLVWPPVARHVERIRVTVNTFWEAGWADIALPRP